MGWEQLPGWFEVGAAWVYDAMAAGCPQDGLLVEVGSAYGRSAAYLAERLLERQLRGSGALPRVVLVDPWDEGHPCYQSTYQKLELGELGSVGSQYLAAHHALVKLHAPEADAVLARWQMGSLAAALRCARLQLKPWGVYLDGEHDYDSVRADLNAWWGVLAPGGILGGHDWGNFDVDRAVRDWQREIAENVPPWSSSLVVRAKDSSWMVRKP